jgi:hypothetical protein
MAEPVNRTILLFDIERFSRRDDVEQAVLRRTLDNVAEDTLTAAGVERTQQYREDRGDGLIVLVSGDVSKAALLRALLTTAPDALHGYNRFAATSTQMRLRIVLAAGEVAFDRQRDTVGGLVGMTSTRRSGCSTPPCCGRPCGSGGTRTACCACPHPSTRAWSGTGTRECATRTSTGCPWW